jgi:hypothetical protein
MKHLEAFLLACLSVRRTAGGTSETSYYTPINNLLDAVGAGLKPKVRCIMQLKNLGAGSPDGGLFTSEQFDRKTSHVKDLSAPARGVIEVKSVAEPVDITTSSPQIDKYWKRYKLVLVTNLRDWQLIGERKGRRVALERYTLALDEASFWRDMAGHPVNAEQAHGTAFVDFLQRVLQHSAPLADPQALASLLASYAREARHRVEHASADANKQLDSLQKSLETSLGVRFNAEEGGHFFRSTLVQTLFYGVFSAWVLRHEGHASAGNPGPFDWKSAAHSLNVPMIAALFGQLSQPAKLKALKLTEVLDWAADALNRVDIDSFFKSFETTRSIQYFYEPFLAAFDPELRKKLGVWYTPEDIVRYQVARVDQVLQTELGLAQGLADPDVVVLDPCCGTGAYLVEVLRVIGEKLKGQGADALAAHQIKQAATTRLFGFELLPAPYVVAHLQLGLLLRQLGTPLGTLPDGTEERVGVYLTNALTGWEPPKEPKNEVLPFPEFDQERDAADQIKRQQKIIVILGNPPYDAYGGVALDEEKDLVAPYKVGLAKDWGIKKFNLDDLYVRFFRLAEKRIAEKGNGSGVVCFISNFSYVREPSFVVMRQHLTQQFDRIWIDNLNGDSRETGKTTPDGLPDPSVFSTPYNKEGIRKGTAVALMVKKAEASQPPTHTPTQASVHYRDWWGADKRMALHQSLDEAQRDGRYTLAQPNAANRHGFKPTTISATYSVWPTIAALSEISGFQGLSEDRRKALFCVSKTELAERIQSYLDPTLTWSEYKNRSGSVLVADYVDFNAAGVRASAIAKLKFDQSDIHRYGVRPFDSQFCYWSELRPLWRRHRPEFAKQVKAGQKFLVTRFNSGHANEGPPISFFAGFCDYHYVPPNAVAYPLGLAQENSNSQQKDWFSTGKANLSTTARTYLAALNLPDPDQDSDTAELLWMHALAVGYSPAYLADNADGIAQDWPRIPLPANCDVLLASAALGRQVAALLDTETAVAGVTSGSIHPALQSIAVVSRKGGGPLQPDEFALTAGWGNGGQGGITMPGRGRSETRPATAQETAGGWTHSQTLDIYLNDQAYWKNLPEAVWGFTIGGYQVIKKWLSYREQRVLGRAMTMAEIMEVTATARRLAALVLLQAQLDANYQAAAATTWDASAGV